MEDKSTVRTTAEVIGWLGSSGYRVVVDEPARLPNPPKTMYIPADQWDRGFVSVTASAEWWERKIKLPQDCNYYVDYHGGEYTLLIKS